MPGKNSEPWRREMERRYYLEIIDLVKAFPSELPVLTVSEWATKKRILPPSLTSLPGPFRWEVTPYLREIADCFSESSPVQRVAFMKGARVGASVGVGENWIGYVIDCAPGPMLYIGADKGSAEMAAELRIDRMLESSGLEDKIFSQSAKAHGKKTGDTKSKKEFPGGFLMPIGPNSPAKLRGFGCRYVFFDEVDAYPPDVGTVGKEEGDPISLAERRTDEYESIRKIFYASTPTVSTTSRIKPLFERGDQRYYYIPCRHCGHMQVLRWKQLKYEAQNEKLDIESVHYECELCGKPWTNNDKVWFLPRGEWRATADAQEANYRSYHLSSLYSPIGMRTWESICLEWLQVKDDIAKLRVFNNTVLGEVWEERGELPKTQKVIAQIEAAEYHIDPNAGHVLKLPSAAKPLIVTLGADVQADRIEAEVVAWGIGFESWSLAYLTLARPDEKAPGTDDPNSAPWKALRAALGETPAGMPIDFALIDSGYQTDTVYDFCASLNNVLPVMGDPGMQEDISGKSPPIRFTDMRDKGIQRVDINPDYFKTQIYANIRRGTETGETPTEPFPGFCHFPAEYTRRYANMLTSERKVYQPTGKTGRSKMVWKQQGRNEALDCRVYALAALHALFRYRADYLEQWYREKGVKDFPRYTWPDFWDWVVKEWKAK